MSNKILVLGGTGKTGRRVAERLWDLNKDFKIASRSTNPAFDWYDASTWHHALKGMNAVYVTFQPDLAVPGAVEIIRMFTETALQSGISKFVLLSGRGERAAEACENIIMDSGVNWTIIRASWFMQNFSESFLLDSILAGRVVLPKLVASAPFVDADDISDVVVSTLLNEQHSNKVYELTGPELLSFREATSLIAAATHRELFYNEIPADEYATLLRSYNVPDDIIGLMIYLFTEVLVPKNEMVTNDIEKVLGRNPTSFNAYISKTIAARVWTPVTVQHRTNSTSSN